MIKILKDCGQTIPREFESYSNQWSGENNNKERSNYNWGNRTSNFHHNNNYKSFNTFQNNYSTQNIQKTDKFSTFNQKTTHSSTTGGWAQKIEYSNGGKIENTENRIEEKGSYERNSGWGSGKWNNDRREDRK
eukprot:Anaeramoba_flamelloidesc42548_g4_i1.p3 GENE.c42548_g4_i1~~c42548_g4_i1.p3  ORF type:complete len:133 (+),score=27.57 c42548_g4_i1:1494-1892(+)